MSGKTSLKESGGRLVRIVWQGALLCAIWQVADEASRHFAWPVPGGVLGLLVMVALLLTGWLPVGAIKCGADWLLTEMLLFFMPAVVSIVNHTELFCRQGVSLLIAIVLGTVLVIVATALAVDWAWRVECRLLHYLTTRRSARDMPAASTQ